MPSTAYHHWRTVRAAALDEIARAHAAIGGKGPGRRHSTQQVNRAYVVLLASEFQGFCRNLHSECIDHVLAVLTPPLALYNLVWMEFTRGRQLDRGNASPGSLGADFGRLGIKFWDEVITSTSAAEGWRNALDMLNEWRNAIAHQNYTSPRLGGATHVQLAQVRHWRVSCKRLALVFDEVMRRHMNSLTGLSPW